MSSRGTFNVDRDIFKHPLLEEGMPYSRREAWIWLIAEASYKPRRVLIAGKMHDVQRGELVVSTRYLATAWRWNHSAVRRFLDALKATQQRHTSDTANDTADGPMIDTQSGTGITRITICNYDRYQPNSKLTDTPSGAAKDAPTDTSHFSNTAENRHKSKEQITERKIRGAEAPPDFSVSTAPKQLAFEGNTIRLSQQHFDKWRESFRGIEDLRAELQVADDYYTDNPPRDGKWFIPVSRWLAKASREAVVRKEQANYGVTWQ